MAAYNVKTHHPLYDDYKPSWDYMRDAVQGEDEVKERGEKYLPMKSGMAAIADDQARLKAYTAYQTRAEFPEIVGPTINGSRGLVHSKETTYELPPALEYLLEKATLDGKTLQSLHEEITTEILTTGRFGLLPGVKPDGTFYIAGYNAESIINWDETEGVSDYVVLDESGQKRNKETNVWSRQEQFLECKLENNTYVATRFDGEIAGEGVPAQKPNQQGLNEVPFVFINTSSLSQNPDDVPLFGLAKIAFRIYRMDADYTHGLHMTSEPTPWVSGYDNPKKAKEEGNLPTSIGASVIWVLPKQAQAGFLEFNGPGLEAQAKAIGSSLERAAIFGAQILSESNRADESGESRRLRLRSQESILMTINRNVAAGLEKALRNIATWAGINPELVKVIPPEDILDHSLEPQELTALVNGWMSGAYSKETLFYNIKRGGMVPQDRTFEDEQDKIDDEGPALSSLTDPTATDPTKEPTGDPKKAKSDNKNQKVAGAGNDINDDA